MKIILSFAFCLVFALSVFSQQTVGAKAEVFNGTFLDGKEFTLDEYSGKVVVMVFWSTKCVICHEELPKLNKLVDKYQSKDVEFWAVTMENETKVAPYLEKKNFKFKIVPNGLGVILKYADRDREGNPNMAFPGYYIISKTGELTLKSNGWDKIGKIDAEVTKLLASQPASLPAEAKKDGTK